MSLEGASAQSPNVIVGLSFEDPECLGVADLAAPVFYLQKKGAVTAQPIPAIIPTGRSDGSGFQDSPVLGSVDCSFDLGTGADPVMLDRLFKVMTRGNVISETVIDAGPPAIIRRTYRYDPSADELALTGRFAIQDIKNPFPWTFYGMHLGQVTITAAANAFVEARFTGMGVGFSRYAHYADPGLANAGTYAGPQWRGQPSNAYRDSVLYVKVTNVGDPLTPFGSLPYTPLQYKVEAIPGGGVPTFAGQTFYQTYRLREDGSYMATWRDQLDQDGYDVGTVDEPGTRLPVQVIFPGTLTDTAAAVALDDVWSITPINAPPLTPTYDDEQGYTLAHARVTITDPDTGASEQFNRDDITLTWAHPMAVAYGDASNQGTRVDRTAEQTLTLTSTRGFTTGLFQDSRINQRPWDIRVDFEGSQWPGVPATLPDEAAPRRSFTIEIPGAKIVDAPLAIADVAPVTETLTITSTQAGFTLTAQDELDV